MLVNKAETDSSNGKVRRSLASLSLDLDNQWSYMKTHGDAGWQSFPSYLDLVVPRVLDFLKARNLTITFFIVGQDAALDKNSDALGQIAAAGHEIGNHSFHHEPWLHLRSEAEIENELAEAEEHIERVTGQRPFGFRGPGYSFSEDILRVLVRRGYKYDASTFPTFLGPLARAYYFMTTRLSAEEKLKRKELFGKMRDGLRPLKPYRCQVGAGALMEMPVTTMPVFKLPIHVSYILYLSAFSPSLALSYFRNAVRFCRLTGTPVSLLLHPLDFLGADDLQALSFFPAMKLPGEQKVRIVGEALKILSDSFNVVTLRQHADKALARLGQET
jgi:hypothetical protein